VEAGVRAYSGSVELAAALGDNGIEIIESCEVLIDDRLVHKWPEPLGGLELRAIRGQEGERDPLRHGQALGPVPARVVEHEDDVPLAPRPDITGKGGQQLLEQRLGETCREKPDRLAAGRLHEGGDMQPLVAMVAEGYGARTDGRPHTAADRLQPETVLVGRPDLD